MSPAPVRDLPVSPAPVRPAPASDASSPSTGPGVVVRGGTHGTVAQLEDLAHAERALRRAAEHLRRGSLATHEVHRVVEGTWSLSPSTAPCAAAAVAHLRSRPAGLAAVADEVDSTAHAVASALRAYLGADTAVRERLVRIGLIGAGHALGEAGPLAWAGAAVVTVGAGLTLGRHVAQLRMLRATPTPLGVGLRGLGALEGRQGPLGVLGWALSGRGALPGLALDASRAEVMLPALGGFLVAAQPGTQRPGTLIRQDVTSGRGVVGETAAVLAGWRHLAERVLHPPRRGTPDALGRPGPAGTVVVGRSAVPAPPTRAPRDVADLVAGVARVYPPRPGGAGEAPPGAIEVTHLDHPDGSRSWVVTVPGTQEWSPVRGVNPYDLTSNLHLMAGTTDDVSAAVVGAMSQAGIAPGEPVVMVGHSQGGLAAVEIAADPVLGSRFDVRGVVTAGSPVGLAALPDHVVGVHLENTSDLVPALDATPVPEARNRTTAQVDLSSATSPALRAAARSPASAHSVEAYAEAAGWVASVGGPSWAAADAAIGSVVGNGRATATSEWFVAARLTSATGASPAAPGSGRS